MSTERAHVCVCVCVDVCVCIACTYVEGMEGDPTKQKMYIYLLITKHAYKYDKYGTRQDNVPKGTGPTK